MYTVDLYLRVRLACHVDGLSQREAASRFGIARETVRKMLRHSEPPGYRRRQPPKRPKLAPFTDIIDRILEEDRTVHRKQHHTAKRIFDRLRDEHGFTGKETIVKDCVRERCLRRREMFVPLSHPPGHAQADFGEADAIIAGVQVLRLLETFDLEVLHGAVKDALRLGAIGYDAVKHLVLCRIERRPPKLDLDIYPYLPRANVATTAAASYMSLLGGGAS